MGISLPIGSHLDESEARRTTRQAEDYFSQAGQRAGNEFSRQVNQGLGRVDTGKSRVQAAALERAFDKAADAAGKLRVEEEKLAAVNAAGNASDVQKIAASERVEKARRAEARAVREAADAVRDLHDAGRSPGGFMDGMSRSMDSLGTAARSFAVAGAPAAILAVGGAAVTASGALIALPAAIGGVAAGIGTLTLGLHGFSDAISDMGNAKKFAEDLQALSPSAQQAALEIKKLVDGPLGELRKATQESLFSGLAQEFHDVTNVMLPSVKTATTGIAGAFNGMAKGSMDQLMKPETATAFDATLRNITQAFTNLAPAAAPFTKAMTDIAQVGSSFLPGLATSVANAATAFSQFITHARDTGQLATWIREGGDMLKEIARLALDVGRAFAGLMPVAREVFPYVSGALHEVSGLLHDHPGLIWGVVGAFAAWKTIEGTAALITSLTAISTTLRALPAVAATAGAGISAGLAGAAATIGRITAGLGAAATVAARGGMPAFVPLPADMTAPRSPQDVQAMINDLTGKSASPGAPSMSRGALDALHGTDGSMPGTSWFGNINPPSAPGMGATAGLAPWGPSALPVVPDSGGGSKAHQLPTVPYSGKDPMSLLQGFPVTASLYSAAGSVLDNQQKVAQAQSDLNALLKSNTATESEITDKRNELARAQREQQESELRLTEAKQAATNKSLKSMQDTHSAMSQLGAGLDQDLGISKGLPGLADNLVRFVGQLAAAPLMAQLEAISKASPSQGGYGLTGVLGAQGLFGSQYTGTSAGQSLIPTYPGVPGMAGGQPYGLAPGTNTGGYGSSGAVFPPWVHALEQMFGVKASTYGGHQESDRNEPGYAPNPMHLNRGIDWTGSPQAMQAFANFMAGQPNAEQVIYQNPLTGQNTEAVAGQPRPGYFAGDLPGHRGHVHTRQAYSIGAPGFDPTNAGPTMIPAVGGAPVYPGTGYPQSLPGIPPLGQVGPAGSPFAGAGGDVQNPTQIGGGPGLSGQGSGIGMSSGGMMDLAMQAGGMGLDMLAPGAGQAAQTGIKLANRGIQFAGQAAGIGIQGLLDTFLPFGGSQLASSNWATRILGGFAGAHPTIPNTAGKQAEPQPQGGQGGGMNNSNNVTNHINVDAQGRDDGQGIARDIAWNQMQAAKGPGM